MISSPQRTRNEMIEALAREICKAAGQKPDHRRAVLQRTTAGPGSAVTAKKVMKPVWRIFAPEARVALKAIDKLGYSLFKKSAPDVLTRDSAVVDLSEPTTQMEMQTKIRKIARQRMACCGR